jgi:polyribonucleotide nucleotidyltransferase
MLHISQIADRRLDRVEDVLKMGQTVKVLLTAIDDRGKLSLTMKGVSQD